ncbi:MAG: hypothetical protein ACOYT8_01675 [Candidatus Dependentiae bacterium]
MNLSFKLLILIFISFSNCFVLSDDSNGNTAQELQLKKIALNADITKLEDMLKKHHQNRIRSYIKFGIFFITSGLLYCLPFAPETITIEKENIFKYALAVLLANRFVQRSYCNAFEIPKKLAIEIADKKNQLEILEHLIQLMDGKLHQQNSTTSCQEPDKFLYNELYHQT